MSLESWAEGMLDKSFFARAVRKSTAKSVVLGWLDAIQNPNAVLAEIAGTDTQGPPPESTEKVLPPAPSNNGQPVTLPRPMLLSMPTKERDDEPDRPGVPPKKVRKQRKSSPPDGQADLPPADPSTGEISN